MNYRRCIWGVLLAQTLLIIFWFSRQGAFLYWDMFYSFQKIHYASESTAINHYIVNDTEFKENEWLDVGYVQDILKVDYEESVLKDSPISIVKNIYKNPYWTIMNAIEAIFSNGVISGWPGIAFNIIMLILSQVLLSKILYRFTSDYRYALLTVIIYGFCGMTISLATYVRFYIFSCFLCIAFTYIHILMWDEAGKKWYKFILLEIIALLFAKQNAELAQFSIFYSMFFVLLFGIALFKNKYYKECLFYSLPVIGGGTAFLTLNTNYLNIIKNPAKVYSELPSSGPLHWVLEMLLTLSPRTFVERTVHEMLLIGKYGFGYWPVFMLIIVLIAVYVFKHRGLKIFSHPVEWVMFGTILGYLFIAISLRFYTEMRYSAQVFPLLAWFISTLLLRVREKTKKQWMIDCFIVGIVAALIISTVSGQRVVYVYDYGNDVVDNIERQGVMNTVVQYYGDNGESNDTIYQTIYLLNSSSKYMATRNVNEISDNLPEEFMYVTRYYSDDVENCNKLGYDVVWNAEAGIYRYHYLKKSAE